MDSSRISSNKLSTQYSLKQNISKSKVPNKVKSPQDQVQLESGSPSTPQAVPKKWLIMNYIAADCNLTSFQVDNIDQMEKVGSNENTDIIAMVDVGPKVSPIPLRDKTKPDPVGPYPGVWSGAKTFYITKDDNKDKELSSKIIKDHGQHVDMSNPDTLKNFIIDTIKKYPAENVALILNDHGGGFTGAMADDTDGDFMSMPQLKKALTEAQEETGKKIDLLGFDACLMAETEVAHSLKDVGNIFIASEENEGGPGWDYGSMLVGKSIGEAIKRTSKLNVTPEEFAKTIVDINKKNNKEIPTFSAINLNKMDKLKNQTNELAKAIIETNDKEAVKQAIAEAENFGGGWSPYGDIRDLGHMTNNLIEKSTDPKIKKAAQGIRKVLKEAIIANEVNPDEHPKSEGLSIYAPTNKTDGYDYKDLDFAKETQWDEAMESLGANFESVKRSPDVWADGSPRKQKLN